jgi:transcriptional regulator GlxA family with amidase domain
VFAVRFADAVGQSPIELLKAVRLTRAVELLTRTNLPVKGIAAQVGYASRSSFTRAFCARHGRPPADFRTPGRRFEAKVA